MLDNQPREELKLKRLNIFMNLKLLGIKMVIYSNLLLSINSALIPSTTVHKKHAY